MIISASFGACTDPPLNKLIFISDKSTVSSMHFIDSIFSALRLISMKFFKMPGYYDNLITSLYIKTYDKNKTEFKT